MLPILTDRGKQLLSSTGDSSTRILLGLILLHGESWTGDYHSMRQLLVETQRAAKGSVRESPNLIYLSAFEAVLAFLSGDQESAIREVKRGFSLQEASGVRVFNFNLSAHGAWAALSCGDHSFALLCIESIRKHDQAGFGRAVYQWLRSWLDWSEGRIDSAIEYMQAAVSDVAVEKYVYGREIFRCSLAVLYFDAGKLDECRSNLDQVLRVANNLNSRWLRLNCLFVDADCKFAQGHEKAGLKSLRHAFGTGRDLAVFTTLMWKPSRMSRLCTLALEHGIEEEYVQEMIRRNKLVPDQRSASLVNWPWPVRISVLGEFQLVIDGKLEHTNGNRQKKVIELLKALVIFGGQDVNASRLTDALWPDSDGDSANNSLKTALHRLRKLLGRQDAVEVSAGHISLNPEVYWSDLGSFEQLTRSGQQDKENSIALEQAILLYKGVLLGHEEKAPWIIAPSERILSEFLNTVTLLGQHWESLQQWHKAIEMYERALEIDCLIESFYMRIMHCQQQLEHRAEALLVYGRCRKILAAELGVDPSPELQVLADTLRGS